MNVEYINPFVQGAQQVLNMVCGEEVVLGKLFLKQLPYACKEVSTHIKIVGDIHGAVIFTLEISLACYIASKMMFGMPVEQMDEMSSSAISELSNMISGTVATLLSGKGKKVDITVPSFKLGAGQEDFPFITEGVKLICMPLLFSNGETFEIDILIEG